LAVKTASEMTFTVLGGALNSTQSNQPMPQPAALWPGFTPQCFFNDIRQVIVSVIMSD